MSPKNEKNDNDIDDEIYEEELYTEKIKTSNDHLFSDERIFTEDDKVENDERFDKSVKANDRKPIQTINLDKKTPLIAIKTTDNYNLPVELKAIFSNDNGDKLKINLNEKSLVGRSFLKNYLLCKFRSFDFKFELREKTIIYGIYYFIIKKL